MSEKSTVRWIDMVDPIYTLCALAGVDTDVNNITGMSINDNRIIIWHIDVNGAPRHTSKVYKS
jgi:hypothetical protein